MNIGDWYEKTMVIICDPDVINGIVYSVYFNSHIPVAGMGNNI